MIGVGFQILTRTSEPMISQSPPPPPPPPLETRLPPVFKLTSWPISHPRKKCPAHVVAIYIYIYIYTWFSRGRAFLCQFMLSSKLGGFWGRDLTNRLKWKSIVITYIFSNVHTYYMYTVSTSRRYVDMVIESIPSHRVVAATIESAQWRVVLWKIDCYGFQWSWNFWSSFLWVRAHLNINFLFYKFYGVISLSVCVYLVYLYTLTVFPSSLCLEKYFDDSRSSCHPMDGSCVFGQKVWTRTRPNRFSDQARFQSVCFDRILYSNTANSRPKGLRFEPHRRHCVTLLSKTH